MGLLLLYVALAIGVSFLCSVMEAVLLSVTPSYVAALEREGSTVGKRLHQFKENVDRPLAAILSLNTIAHTVGAAGVGAQAAVVFGEAYTGIVAGVLTLLILVLSEIIPKTLGAVYWRTLTPALVRLLTATIIVMWPLVKLSQGLTYLLSQDEDEAAFSREEFTAMAELGEEEGVFEEKESRILRNLFRFNSLRVKDVMTPRTVIFQMPEHRTIGDVVEEHDEFRFSRIPVYDDDPDDITGYVLKDEMLLRAAQEEFDVSLSEISRDILVVHETLALPDLLERLLDRLEHIALVVDEYGGVAGVVTMEDVVETLLGLEIVDEADSVEDMQALARKQWFKRARELGMVSDEALEAPTNAEAEASSETVLESDTTAETESQVAAEMARRSSSESPTDEQPSDRS
ncbi:CNNM domain-containing protein [Salinibacter ruber]|jgi:CBS domain containing-hemolysin-like protein|uniref:CBS domain containing-hemolysin-like protein n=3 Tax=Salinibacter ruber TaxID=146919 RepID=A0A9X2Q2G9_9BACT|nr:CNNM domain-containing protein [Salinibacter ruber]MBB4090177.1 CBS domain containing-hemolysin-like protein [Salinibacter ruber]MCS3631890.1 CBS domain containing-hemolysin-like protein [Salinibacter ruber]MCS3643640.1 CBS domain containing-hemolysin-like protein [Salinibacter ruber]MCS3657824.1 CBS domain containing-hemolysin-like protein [Salinibacter ruber]MCS3660559.1 CBS domain containing-hemolysin-like protein [Salinibacter ruber]